MPPRPIALRWTAAVSVVVVWTFVVAVLCCACPAVALGCPMFGCDPQHSFDSQLAVPGAGATWQMATPPDTTVVAPRDCGASGAQQRRGFGTPSGCAFNTHGVVLCQGAATTDPTTTTTPRNATTIAAFTTPEGANPRPHGLWSAVAPTDAVRTPFVMANGVALAYDHTTLWAFSVDGRVTAQSPLFGGGGGDADAGDDVASLGVSDSMGFVVLTFTHGSVSVYLQDSVPVASRWLTDTRGPDGTPGVWSPCGTPVVVDARVYLVTRWLAHGGPPGPTAATGEAAPAPAFSNAVRVFAMDVHRSTVNRTAIAWTVDLIDADWQPQPAAPASVSTSSAAPPTPPAPPSISLAYADTALGPVLVLPAAVTGSAATTNALVGLLDKGTAAVVQWTTAVGDDRDRDGGPAPVLTDTALFRDPRNASAPTLWAVVDDGSALTRVEFATGRVLQTVSLASADAAFVSQVVVARVSANSTASPAPDDDDTVPVVVGVASDRAGTLAFVALQLSANDVDAPDNNSDDDGPTLLWRLPLPDGVTCASGAPALFTNNVAASGVSVLTDVGLVTYAAVPQ